MSGYVYNNGTFSAAQIAHALGGKKAGDSYSCRCPAHEDRNPSFSISDGKNGRPVFNCFAGCPPETIINALRAEGLWPLGGSRPLRGANNRNDLSAKVPASDRNQKIALGIWDASESLSGTLAETYLEGRGISEKSISDLRFRQNLKHPDGSLLPVMIGRVADPMTNKFLGVHRTFLDPSGTSKASVEKPKLMLGPCIGGGVKLREATDTVLIGEGIETCLSAMQVTKIPAWAALSTSGMKTLQLPASITNIYVLADGDDAGEEAAFTCARRWSAEGRIVRIARPPRGYDFNDILLGKNIPTSQEQKG